MTEEELFNAGLIVNCIEAEADRQHIIDESKQKHSTFHGSEKRCKEALENMIPEKEIEYTEEEEALKFKLKEAEDEDNGIVSKEN